MLPYELTLDAVAFSPRTGAAAPDLNSSRYEAIFPLDRADKLVNFGNVARLSRRGVSVYRIHGF
jgi:hypothetical protein